MANVLGAHGLNSAWSRCSLFCYSMYIAIPIKVFVEDHKSPDHVEHFQKKGFFFIYFVFLRIDGIILSAHHWNLIHPFKYQQSLKKSTMSTFIYHMMLYDWLNTYFVKCNDVWALRCLSIASLCNKYTKTILGSYTFNFCLERHEECTMMKCWEIYFRQKWLKNVDVIWSHNIENITLVV